jgi:hypothetical protein
VTTVHRAFRIVLPKPEDPDVVADEVRRYLGVDVEVTVDEAWEAAATQDTPAGEERPATQDAVAVHVEQPADDGCQFCRAGPCPYHRPSLVPPIAVRRH